MTASLVSAIADVLAATGIIVSLLIVAFQIHKNSLALQNQHWDATIDKTAELFSRQQDQRVATILDKGFADFEKLDASEKLVFGGWANEYILVTCSLIQFRREGAWGQKFAPTAFDRRLKWFFNHNGCVQWWRADSRHPIPPRFEQKIEDIVQSIETQKLPKDS